VLLNTYQSDLDNKDGIIVGIDEGKLADLILKVPCDKCMLNQMVGGVSDKNMLILHGTRYEGMQCTMTTQCMRCSKLHEYSTRGNKRVYPPLPPAHHEELRRRRKRYRLNGNGDKITERKGHGVYVCNIKYVASRVLNNIGEPASRGAACLSSELAMNTRTFERIARIVWYNAVITSEQHLAEYRRSLVNKGVPIMLEVDGAWSQRRNGRQHCLILLNHDGYRVLPVLVVCIEKDLEGVIGCDEKGNEIIGILVHNSYNDASRLMETAAWRKVSKRLKDEPEFRKLVHGVCVDKDNSIPTIIKVLPISFIFPLCLWWWRWLVIALDTQKNRQLIGW